MSLTWKKEADPLITSIYSKHLSPLDVYMKYDLLLRDIWLENTYNDLTLSFPQTLKSRPDIFSAVVSFHMLDNVDKAQLSDAVLLFIKELQQLSINLDVNIYIYDSSYYESFSVLQSIIEKVDNEFKLIQSEKILVECYLKTDEVKSSENILACLNGE
ncbi:hypothetical protein DNH61_03790 [Paenibacillus sambharensis]|uniref:Uncharacterized protein n=2 Tax=Paenibacillus sambharensis TaxID=1803190 RepID=A0A2W1M0G1_9BACL|nr:hypothetical protein DNH61_03790 [Paenibacillus sambharensis]